MLASLLTLAVVLKLCHSEIFHTTKFFILPIEPNLFNWTLQMGDEYNYQASILKAPDLPEWLQYLYSRRHRTGFLYGVPPPNQKSTEIEIVAISKRTYETRRRVIHLNIQEKTNPAKYQVHLKIDNLNVEDLFDSYKLSKFLDIFRFKLWKESFADLYVTFMTSALTQGARRPLRPSESEGVVMRLGSAAEFSNNLIELQEEVKPLWRMQSCPRDFKRTTVERWFREEGFALDWCSFKLIEPQKESISNEGDSPLNEFQKEQPWKPMFRSEVPGRSYSGEAAITLLIPAMLLVVLVVMLSIILCFHHECMEDDSEAFFQSVFTVCEEYARMNQKKKKEGQEEEEKPVQNIPVFRATSTLRSLSQARSVTPDVASAMLMTSDDDTTRPNPPPYSGTLRTANSEL